MVNQYCSLLLALGVFVIGCQSQTYSPVSPVAKEIKSGTPLEEIKEQLGEPHAPTSLQARHVNDVVSKMPEPMRSNAQKDKSLAWGNDSAFFIVKVNDRGIAWVTAWRE